jgi:dTDP-glucose 4,6-dehydratase
MVGETYNIGGNCEKDNLALVKMICKIMDEKRPIFKSHESLISFVTDRPGHDWRYAIDNRKTKDQLGLLPKYDIIKGLNNTVQYYLGIYS